MVGSVAEGTRIGLGNELDLTLTFAAWKGDAIPFAVRDDDAFHLYKVLYGIISYNYVNSKKIDLF